MFAAVVGFLLIACSMSIVYASGLGKNQQRNQRHFTHGNNGQPGCRLHAEFARKWRNNNDPLRYWRCHPEQRQAVSFRCPTEFMYYDPRQCCVHYSRWRWTRPFDPMTFP